MARVPLIQEQEHPELAEVIEKFRTGRRGKLINIYRMLLNAPPLAASWFNHSNAVRWKTTLSGRLREIVIIRMGHLTGSQDVLRQHLAGRDAPRHVPTNFCTNPARPLIFRALVLCCLRHTPTRADAMQPIPSRYPHG